MYVTPLPWGGSEHRTEPQTDSVEVLEREGASKQANGGQCFFCKEEQKLN